MELKVGKMTNSELAQWFGIAEKTLRNNKIKKLNELKDYADFYEDKGKVFITHIYDPEYHAKVIYPRVKELMPTLWSKTGLDTSSRVGREIYVITQDEGYPHSEGTVLSYTSKAKRENYGVAFGENGGLLGRCTFEYAKKDIDGRIVPFTKEEREIYREFTKEYYGEDIQERSLFIVEALATRDEELEMMTAEQLRELIRGTQQILTSGKDYWEWKTKLQAKLGFDIVKATRLIPNEIGAFGEEKIGIE